MTCPVCHSELLPAFNPCLPIYICGDVNCAVLLVDSDSESKARYIEEHFRDSLDPSNDGPVRP